MPDHETMSRRQFLLLTSATLSFAFAARADDQSARRIRAGARVFRTLLAADLRLTERATDGVLHVAIYSRDVALGATVAALIAPSDKGGAIRDVPVLAKVVSELPEQVPAGIFIASPLDAQSLARWVKYCQDRQVVLYSPFEGDVERGVMAGLAIEATVQPYLNENALDAAGVELKPFFLRVAKVYR